MFCGIFIKEIARNEKQFLLNECNVRKKFDKFNFLEKTTEEKETVLLNAPIIYRAEEKYICPEEPFWKDRYYDVLFHMEYCYDNTSVICRNYFEGLEWVYTYYNSECPNWKWKYNYHYPPLFTDLCKFLPNEGDILIYPDGNAVTPNVQLCYVLPYSNLYLLPIEIQEKIYKDYSHLYPIQYGFHWAFCRYFWESHPILPDISLKLLEDIIKA